MRVFVTGASGFIGEAVTKELLGAGHQVLGLARSDKSAEKLRKLGAEALRGELKDLDVLKKGAQSSDGVIHLGFGRDFGDMEGMCRLDREVITALASVMEGTNKPLVVPSGTLLLKYGHVGTEDEGYDTNNPFAALRGQSETLVHSYATKGVRASVVRVSPTCHGDDDEGFLSFIIQIAKEKGCVGYLGEGSNRWPAVHRLDTARLFRLALEKGAAGSTFHAVGDRGVQWKDIAEAIGSIFKLPAKSMTWDEAQAHYGWMAGLVTADNPTSNQKTQEQLGWKPENVGLIADIRDGSWYASL